jgi:hypothetical protein
LSRGSKLHKFLFRAHTNLEKAAQVAEDLDAGDIDEEFIKDVLEDLATIQSLTAEVDEMICLKSTYKAAEV